MKGTGLVTRANDYEKFLLPHTLWKDVDRYNLTCSIFVFIDPVDYKIEGRTTHVLLNIPLICLNPMHVL